MMSQLEKYSCGSTKPTLKEISRLAALKLPLVATTTPIDIQKFMGKWFVIANIPMSVEVGASNSIENYHWDAARGAIDVLFEYVPKGASPQAVKSKSEMYARIVNAPINSFWALDPKILGLYLPLKLSYLVLEIADDGSYALIGVPDRSYFWVLTRLKPTIKEGGKASEILLATESLKGLEPQNPLLLVGGEAVSVAASKEIFELDIIMEQSIIRKALLKAKELGYDTEKVLCVKWSV